MDLCNVFTKLFCSQEKINIKTDNSRHWNQKQISYYILLGIFGGLYLTFVRGIVYLIGNQTGYFLFGLRLYDPTFIPQDWLTWKTFQHHIAFGYLLYFLQWIGPLHITAMFAQMIIMIALSFGLLILSRRFLGYPIHVYLAVILWLGLIRAWEMGLGAQQLIAGYLQPSEIAGSLMMLGLALLFERRYLVSGVVLGLAGLFHAQFLAGFGPVILVTALYAGVCRTRKTILSFGMPLGLLWGILVVYVGYALLQSHPPTIDTMWILTDFRAPGDNNISHWDKLMTMNWLIWTGAGAMAMFMLPTETKFKELRICFLAAIVISMIGVIQAAFIKIPSITIMQLWRVSPLALILGLLVALDHCIHLSIKAEEVQRRDKIFIACLIVAGMVLTRTSLGRADLGLLWLAAIPLSIIVGLLMSKLRKDLITRSKAILASLFILLVVIMVLSSYRGLLQKSHNHMLYPIHPSLGEMEKWVRESTPKDSIFVIPPEMEYMRIRARRAVIIDWRTIPAFASDMQEWYQRLCDVTGIHMSTPTYSIMIDGYNHLDTARAMFLHQRYSAHYVVVSAKDHVGGLSGLIERFRNEDYRVLEIPSMEKSEVTFSP